MSWCDTTCNAQDLIVQTPKCMLFIFCIIINTQYSLRVVGLAAQKFLSDICYDSFHYTQTRQEKVPTQGAPSSMNSSTTTTSSNNSQGQKRFVLTTEDLSASLQEYGIMIKKPEYYSDDVQPKQLAARAAQQQQQQSSTLPAPPSLK